MGIIIPGAALEDASYPIEPGEKLLLQKFKTSLPDSCLLWHNADLPGGCRPSITAYIPRLGIFVIEVKEWFNGAITKIDETSWEVSIDGGPKDVPAPYEQAKYCAEEIKKLLEARADLLAADGARKGSFKLPINYFVAFSNINRADLTEEASNYMPPDKYLFIEDITAVGESLKGAELAKYFLRISARNFWPTLPLTPEELVALRGALSRAA